MTRSGPFDAGTGLASSAEWLDFELPAVPARLLVLFALLGWVLLLRAPFFLVDHLGSDEGLYFTTAARLLDGARLYTDIWDNKPVGIFLIYAGVILAFGKSLFAINLASALAVYLTAALLFLAGLHGLRSFRAGALAAFIFPCYMLDLEAGGANAENFFIIFDSFSALILLRHGARGFCESEEAKVALFFGLSQGIAFQIKSLTLFHTLGLGIVFAAILIHRGRRPAALARTAAAFLCGYSLCTGLVFTYFAVVGRFADFAAATLVSPTLYVEDPFGLRESGAMLGRVAARASYFWPLVLFSLAAIPGLTNQRRAHAFSRFAVLVLVGWAAGALLGAMATGFAFYHYFIALAPALSLLTAYAVDRLIALNGAARSGLAVLALIALVSYPLAEDWRKLRLSWPGEGRFESAQIAAAIAQYAQPGSKIYLVDLNPMAYGLSGTIPATRYPFPAHILARPRAFGVDPLAEIDRSFGAGPVLVLASRHLLEARHDPVGDRIRWHLGSYMPIEADAPPLPGGLVMYRRAS